MERIRKEEGAFLSSGWPVREGGSTHDGWGTRHKNVAAVGDLFFFLTLAIDHLVAYNALTSKLSFAKRFCSPISGRSNIRQLRVYREVLRERRKEGPPFLYSPEGEQNLRNPITLLSLSSHKQSSHLYISQTLMLTVFLSVFEQRFIQKRHL